jgi:hypothetical protein
MSKTVVVWSCAHADPSAGNERFDWLASFLYDLKPDMCIDLGDGADMRSLNTYDTRYPQAIVSQNYEEDINSYNDSQERLRWKFRHSKKKRPFWVGFEGNHENRIKKAISNDPRLEGQRYGVSFGHLQTNHWFDEYHEYSNSAPCLVNYDGIIYGHYVSSGNYGSAMSTKHHGYSLVEKLACSATVGHSHKFNYYHKADARPSPLNGLVVGCFKGKEEAWAGQANQEWRKGVAVKRYLENGNYDLQWVSVEALREEYK